MEEALELARFLPMSYRTRSDQEYIAYLWDSFQCNYESGKYEFASLAYHLLYMSFASFTIWQIRQIREQDFKNALLGFNNEAEKKLLSADSPFKFHEEIKEGQIFRFLKLVGCTDTHIGQFTKFVKRRNKIAHPTGSVFFNDHVSLDSEMANMLHEVANIQQHMRPIVWEAYSQFLIKSADIDERGYSDPDEEVEVNLLHHHYFSERDVEFCLAQGISSFQAHEQFPAIQELHQSLIHHHEMA